MFFNDVIEALSGKADYDKDENVVVDESSLFTRQRVSDFVPIAVRPSDTAGTDKERGLMPRSRSRTAPPVATSMTVKLKPVMGVGILG